MDAIILVAGVGIRLGKGVPKCLVDLTDAETILDHQLSNLSGYVYRIILVVGFGKELIMDAYPDLIFLYNHNYKVTNTAKSLLCALRKFYHSDILQLNGDVVFDNNVLPGLTSSGYSSMAVDNKQVGEEEIKYSLRRGHLIAQVSKTVKDPLGEAVGINYFRKEDIPLIINGLELCSDTDYFEKGIEYAIDKGLKILPYNIGELQCIEVDFPQDLQQASEIARKLK